MPRIRAATPGPRERSMRVLRWLLAVLVVTFASTAFGQQVKLTFWSHWAAEKIKRDFVEEAIRRYESAHPNVKIEE
jgi:ABC-type glycerol-3-phosphate transport system substrate-binding protein